MRTPTGDEEGGRRGKSFPVSNYEDRGYIEKLSDARTVNQPNKQSLAEVDGNRTCQTRIALKAVEPSNISPGQRAKF
jgi:hypothetical protein